MTIENKRQCYLFPVSLSECIESLTKPALKSKGLAGSRLLTGWEAVVGPALARHTIPEKLTFSINKKTGGQKTHGTLTIACENGFATELQHMQPMIIERIAQYFGYQAVSRITISHSWIPAAAVRPQPPSLPSTLPQECVALTQTIDDPELRAALQSFAKSLSGQTP